MSAVVVNYNSGGELRLALESIREDLSGTLWEAVVIDNASRDGSADAASAAGDRVRLVRNTENVGFGRGVNQAAALASAPLLLILNPDCRLTGGAIAALRSELLRHHGCAVAGPRILNPDGSLQGSARGDPDMLTGLFGRTSRLRSLLPWLPVSRRNVTGGEPGGEASAVVDWVSGACMLVRRDAFDAVGGFDERYFLYWEDADFCRRLRARGHHVRYVPAATAVHRVGQSSQTARAASVRAFHESAYLYYATHVAPGPLNPKRVLARALLAARCRWQLRQHLAH